MAGDDHGDPSEGKLRRRRSTHHDENELPAEEPELDSRTEFGTPRRVLSEPIQGIIPPIPSPTTNQAPDSSRNNNPRVRFSTDVEMRTNASKNEDHIGPIQGERRHDRPLSDPTFGDLIHAAGTGVPETPPVMMDNMPKRSSTLPMKSRDRGFSLRRSLFNRNLESQSKEEDNVIELDQSASSQPPGLVNRADSSATKKSDTSHTTISISPVLNDDGPTAAFSRPSKPGASLSSLPNYEVWARSRRMDRGVMATLKTFCAHLRNRILRINEIPPSKDGRHIDLRPYRDEPLVDERTNKPFVGNTIRSSRYTFWSFFPRQLIAQFSKLANFYFLCVSILQMIPGLSTTGRYTTILPLLIFVGISMGKEGYDDLRRYRLDKEENNRSAFVFRATGDATRSDETGAEISDWQDTKWKDIKVGDILKLERDEAVPADIVLLHANGPNGAAYVETMALDGETNLKSKLPSPPLAKRCRNVDGLGGTQAHFAVEDPNIDLYKFEGKVTVSEETLPLTNNEIVYRGSVLRNTQEAFGMVIYSGEECKIRMNATKNPRIKAPALQTAVNRVVIIIVCFVIALSIFNTAAYQIWARDFEDDAWYLDNAGVAFFPILASFIIMFNTMIPLSLYVSLEIVKLAQMFLMNDVDMYDEASNTPMEPRTSTINEELGQVSYIFSDKTGTLTNNSMRFRKISLAGTAWFHDADLLEEQNLEKDRGRLIHKKRSKGKQAQPRKSNVSEVRKSILSSSDDARLPLSGFNRNDSILKNHGKPRKLNHGGRTEEMLAYIQQKPHTVFARRVHFFILSLALCHTCIPEKDQDGNISFQAASPDELALVQAAQDLGYLVVDRQSNSMTIRTYPSGVDAEPAYDVYEILDVIEFSSARKRMSIVVRMPDQRICVFCKGADSTIMRLLRLSGLASDKVTEIEERVNRRKSVEAQQALRRLSEHGGKRVSGAGASISLSRASSGRRSSVVQSPMHSTRNDIDQWLKDRENDSNASGADDNTIYYTPRPSIQLLSPRESMAQSEALGSMHGDKDEGLVEEALVMNDSAVFERCFQHVNDFATEGLRTLLYAHRYISEQDYAAWKKAYQDATTSLVDRTYLIEKAGDQIERDFELTGATAIEDKLQKGVPEAIDKLRRANVKLWMLTGDKRETAINIGHSCRLVKDYSTLIILDHESGEVDKKIAASLVSINRGTVAHSVIVIDGQTLSLIDAEQAVKDLFIDLAILADSVICCRASPSQKASLVRSIRKKVKKSVTLAIGDGANDIAMIQEAHVGIGITGREGLQAARTSDYSIAQFRFLLKLLLVHGRWNYIRTCKYTLGTFWKEMLFYLTQALYQRWAGYTGTSLYEPWSLSMFNTLFTSLPVIFMGVFEKDLAASTLLAVPELYNKGQLNLGFNIKVYLWWTLMAVSEAMIVFFIMLSIYGQAIFTRDNGLYAMGALTFTTCVIVISMKMQAIEMHNKSITAAIAIVLSVGGWFLWNIILSVIYADNTIYNVKEGILHRFGQNALWWLTVILAVGSAMLFEIGVSSVRAFVRPTDVDVFQEFEQDREIRKRFEEAAAEELQQGWDRGTKKSSLELVRQAAAQEAREAEVQEILDRPRTMEEGKASGGAVEAMAGVRRRQSGFEQHELDEIHVDRNGDTDAHETDDTGKGKSPRKSVEIQELFSKGFGSIRKEHLK